MRRTIYIVVGLGLACVAMTASGCRKDSDRQEAGAPEADAAQPEHAAAPGQTTERESPTPRPAAQPRDGLSPEGQPSEGGADAGHEPAAEDEVPPPPTTPPEAAEKGESKAQGDPTAQPDVGATPVVAAQPGEEQQAGDETPENAGPQEDPALVEAGKAALGSLKPLQPGEKYVSYFEVKMGPSQVVGYVIATLERPQSEGDGNGNIVHDYTVETLLDSPSGARVSALATAKLRPDFEPVEIEVKHTMVKPEVGEEVSVQRAVIGPDRVHLSVNRGDNLVEKDTPRPEQPFFYGIETLVQRLDIDKYDRFIAREFDLETGAGRGLTFVKTTSSNGTATLFTRTTTNVGSYQFWFDGGGGLVRWGEPSLPVLFVRTTEERAKSLKSKMSTNGGG